MNTQYFSKTTLSHLKPQQGLPERYQRRVIDVTLAAKLTLTYGKYHLAMLHRQLAMSEERATYQQAERSAGGSDKTRHFDLWSYSSLQDKTDASIVLCLLRTSFRPPFALLTHKPLIICKLFVPLHPL